MDQILKGSCLENQLLRFIHVGLACVEDCPLDRPTISEVVSMLEDESFPLPMLKKPAFLNRRMLNIDEDLPKKEKSTVNGMSISTMNPR